MAVDVAFPELFDLVASSRALWRERCTARSDWGSRWSASPLSPLLPASADPWSVRTLIGQGPAAMLSNSMLSAWLVAVALAGLVVRLQWRLGQMPVVVDAFYLPIWFVLGATPATAELRMMGAVEYLKPEEEILPRVERTVELAVPASELWRHLVDGELASLWMGAS